MDEPTFQYSTPCSFAGCENLARTKIAAPWSYGPLRELKNYGLACEEHREVLLDRARRHRDLLAVGDDETVGPVDVYPLSH